MPVPITLATLGVTPWGAGRDIVTLGAWWHAAWIGWFAIAPVILLVAFLAMMRRVDRWPAIAWCVVVFLHLLVIVTVAARFAAWATPAVWLLVVLQVGAGLAALAAGVRATDR